MRKSSKKKVLVFGLVFLMVAVVFAGIQMNISAAKPLFAGGDGTPQNPYQIANVNQLQNMNLDLSGYYILKKNIDASRTSKWNEGAGFEPIGTFSDSFKGDFDGKGYKISGLCINRPLTNYVGLFGNVGDYLTSAPDIRNVGLEDANIIGGSYVGALVGYNYGQILNSYSTGTVTGSSGVGGLEGISFKIGGGPPERDISNSHSTCNVNGGSGVGGLVGGYQGHAGNIINSYATGNVNGNSGVGGFVGKTEYDVWIENSYSTGNVVGDDNVGGFIGTNMGDINYCYSTGSVDGNNNVGGFCGFQYAEGGILGSYSVGSVNGVTNVGGFIGNLNAVGIADSYSMGSVTGVTNVGGLVGFIGFFGNSIKNSYSVGSVNGVTNVGGLVGEIENEFPWIINSYWDIETSGQSTSAGGEGKSTAEMKQQTTFVGWDFVNTWDIIEDLIYPFLRWQGIPNEATGVINDYIQELPDSAFNKRPEQRKQRFNDMLNDVSAKIEANEYQNAIDTLQNDIRTRCDGTQGGNPKNDWIIDSTAQADLCGMIDTLIAYLGTLV